MRVSCQIQKNAEQFPDQLALDGAVGKLSYRELNDRARAVSQLLLPGEKNRKIAIWGGKDTATYISLLGVYYAGHCYTPFLPHWPKDRLESMANILKLEEIIYCSGELENFFQFCQTQRGRKLKIYVQNIQTKSSLLKLGIINQIEVLETSLVYQQAIQPMSNELAYILFTSGSTGEPKGVPISRGNLSSYLKNFKQHYSIGTNDRMSHTFELSFDLSVHDIFIAWTSGATLCIPSYEDLMFPHTYIQQQNLSIWFSVPTLVTHMQKIGLLRHFNFPSLKQSFFCGEPLFESTARAWQSVSPNSTVVNMYGPTEGTIAFTHYQLPKKENKIKSRNSILSIGRPFKGLDTVSSAGELILVGEQVTYGYLNNPQKTKACFYKNDKKQNCYRTGDLCSRDEEGDLFFVARMDQQVKINGYRIELFEIEAVLKEVTENQHCYCLTEKDEDGLPKLLVAVFDSSVQKEGSDLLSKAQHEKIRERLPHYMIPERFIGLEVFPTNTSGKIDRKELEKILMMPPFKNRG